MAIIKILVLGSLGVILAPLAIAISWFAILFAPIFLIGALPLFIPLTLILHRANSELDIPVREKELFQFPEFAQYKARLETLLQSKLDSMKMPFRGCTCLSLENGRVKLVVRLISTYQSISHQVIGLSLNDAVAKLEWKLTQKREGLNMRPVERVCRIQGGQCAFRTCINNKDCPGRIGLKSHFTEIAKVWA